MTEATQPSKMYADAAVSQRIAGRAATEFAAFLLPHLKPGMSVLDVGCGPGSITLGLAVAVAPGPVVGLDIERAHVENAMKLASESGVHNVRFEVGDAYTLPVPDASFDAVFAHALLIHLAEPVRALREFRRVLRPGGVAAVREREVGLPCIIEPPSRHMDQCLALFVQFLGLRGSPGYSRRLRSLMLEAGFARAEAHATSESFGSPETMPELLRTIDSLFRSGAFRRAADENGWADAAKLGEVIEGAHAWAERPDAFFALVAMSALGWVDA
jgi:ubiquinone/menaquinone biosynthesis C-methylase UbiE